VKVLFTVSWESTEVVKVHFIRSLEEKNVQIMERSSSLELISRNKGLWLEVKSVLYLSMMDMILL